MSECGQVDPDVYHELGQEETKIRNTTLLSKSLLGPWACKVMIMIQEALN